MEINPPIRGWYNDAEVADDGSDPAICDDIAEQLVRRDPGRNINVILAGGRGDFFNETVQDVEGEGKSYRQDYPLFPFSVLVKVFSCYRTDGADLVREWIDDRKARGASYKYTTSAKEMKEFNDFDVDYFMGLFAIEDMEYQLEQTAEMDDPTLAEMTETALNILNTKPNGFVAFIEEGLVDHGHHGNKVTGDLLPVFHLMFMLA